MSKRKKRRFRTTAQKINPSIPRLKGAFTKNAKILYTKKFVSHLCEYYLDTALNFLTPLPLFQKDMGAPELLSRQF
jgi:hypothetical protein